MRVLNCTAYSSTSILRYSSTKYWTDSLRKSMCRMMASIRVQENALEGRKQCGFFFPPPTAIVIMCVPSTSPYNYTTKSGTINKGKLHIQSWPGRFRRTPRDMPELRNILAPAQYECQAGAIWSHCSLLDKLANCALEPVHHL